ncbi:substrate-binding periplasmic protein [Aestuariispira insulae]|uniref:substrate-binding periplasmic protein n=1 Tax=Aestuariispira insulae TaxID=1461337 RepID=UPI0015F24D49|nr:transporter substrate-binding domain-containing protein [Aestuariispira insulae]
MNLLTEEYAPFNYLEDGRLTGIGADMVRAMSEMLGIPFKARILPWKRAYQQALTDPDTALFSTTRLPTREEDFQWVGPLFEVQDYLFGNDQFAMEINNLDEARDVGSILVQNGGGSHVYLKSLGFQNLQPYTVTDKQLVMLTMGRVDLIYLSDLSAYYQLRINGMASDKIKPVFRLKKAELYLVFAKTADPQIVASWQDAFEQVRATGRREQIIRRYLPRASADASGSY